MKLSIKEKQILSITIACFGIFMTTSGIIMKKAEQPIIKTNYKLDVVVEKNTTQAKKIELKLKNIELEINTPLSVDVKDYIENIDQIETNTLNKLQLDTSLVKVTEAGNYQYSITCGKKKYLGNIKVKAKKVITTITAKTITIKAGNSLPGDIKEYITENLSEEEYKEIQLNLDEAKSKINVPGEYAYYIVYKNSRYDGKIIIENPEPTGIQVIEKDNSKDDNIEEIETETATITQ